MINLTSTETVNVVELVNNDNHNEAVQYVQGLYGCSQELAIAAVDDAVGIIAQPSNGRQRQQPYGYFQLLNQIQNEDPERWDGMS